jgi:hypothetical protein
MNKKNKRTLKQLLIRSALLIKVGDWSSLGNYLVTELVNIMSQKNIFSGDKILFCPICKYEDRSFINLCNSDHITWNSACPNCNSRSRHRGLYFLYQYILRNNKKRILHFAPEDNLKKIITSFDHSYKTTDLKMPNVDLPQRDIQNLDIADHSYDIIFNNHVLEHVPDDWKALEEISRILAVNGLAIITVPGDWKRTRTKYYDPPTDNGHHRLYGLDFINKLEKYFSSIMKIDLTNFDGPKHAIGQMEIAFICKK